MSKTTELTAAAAIGGASVPARSLSWEPDGVREALQKACGALRSAKRVAVIAHRNPDGDAIGSTLGMCAVLGLIGVDATPVNCDAPPDEFCFLPRASEFASSCETKPDVTVLLDCSTRDRTGLADVDSVWGHTVICLDHHRTAVGSDVDIFVHDPDAAATAELVYRVAVALGVELTPALATCLFTSLHTDTGSFRYSVTREPTMELGAALLAGGIDTWEIASRVFEQQRPQRLRLLAHALGTLHVTACGRLAAIHVTDAMMTSVGATSADADGFINHARSVRGVEVAVQLTQDGSDAWRASFRSRGLVDVAAVAARLGGGGHRNAAGARLLGDIGTVQQQLERALLDLLDGEALD